eukprot:SAG31_NODE_1674_length_7560_cov_2.804852_11_plen_82_part_00
MHEEHMRIPMRCMSIDSGACRVPIADWHFTGIYRDIIIESDYDPLRWRNTDPVKISTRSISRADPIKKELTLQVHSLHRQT